MKILVTGGARSGKSGFAERYAAALGDSGVYLATSETRDGEMEDRVRRHRERREQAAFFAETVEEPLELAELLERLSGDGRGRVVLVDCLTLWLSNWLLRVEHDRPEERLEEVIRRLNAAIASFRGTLLLVTNEVGDGVVPAYPLGRLFRDYAGLLNQRAAAVCDEVYLVTAGIPVELKRIAFRIPEKRR
jgi:adenosylcobinamide kinase/adenosylcobinamide-phosphate guanylyltransferase